MSLLRGDWVGGPKIRDYIVRVIATRTNRFHNWVSVLVSRLLVKGAELARITLYKPVRLGAIRGDSHMVDLIGYFAEPSFHCL